MSRGTARAALFVAPAAVILGALVLYPIVATVAFSFRDGTGTGFVGLQNYAALFTNPRILTAIRNSAVWAVVVPSVVTMTGLVFGVVTERARFGRAFRTTVFMPMAISLLAGGVIWRLVYDHDADVGMLNAALRSAAGVVRPPGPYPGASPVEPARLEGGAITLPGVVRAGQGAQFGLVRVPSRRTVSSRPARPPSLGPGRVSVVVFRDFAPGADANPGLIDPGEVGLRGIRVYAVDARSPSGAPVASGVTGSAGQVSLRVPHPGPFRVVLPETNFRPAYAGVEWLGPRLITFAVMAAYVWMWAGFAMVVVAAGLSAIPREVLEAARVDGAGEWRVFRHVTVPLLYPVLGVVFVTMLINVLKVFDIVLAVAPENVQDDANVIALEMWRTAFGARDLGLGSAVAVLLFVLVVPVVFLNVGRFRARS